MTSTFMLIILYKINLDFSDIDRQMMLQDNGKDSKLGDVLLGTCEVPLSSVLTHRTGTVRFRKPYQILVFYG